MKLHEHQAKQLFSSVGIRVPRGAVARTSQEVVGAYETLRRACLPAPARSASQSEAAGAQAGGGSPSFSCSVKAQVHAGGRGKAGGVIAVHSAEEASTQAARLIGQRLVTHQTGPQGLPVSAVLLEERIEVERECYLALTIDRFRAAPVALASRQGGVDIEEVAAKDARAILREPVDIEKGVSKEAGQRLVEALGLSGDLASGGIELVQAMWTLVAQIDASLLEINPLVVTKDHGLLALDAKVTLDDNALFRHPELAALRDESQEHPLELKAGRIGISYVGLDGDIGCLVNGAGLAMATNDIIKLCGGTPANFLDVGGGANVEQVTKAFSIILSDTRVKAVLVNIFGGIMRCDWIAEGLLNATQQLEVRVPIVVRLQGTNVEEGRRLLAGAERLNLISVNELAEAARRVVELAK